MLLSFLLGGTVSWDSQGYSLNASILPARRSTFSFETIADATILWDVIFEDFLIMIHFPRHRHAIGSCLRIRYDMCKCECSDT